MQPEQNKPSHITPLTMALLLLLFVFCGLWFYRHVPNPVPV